MKETLGESLSSKHIDYTKIKDIAKQAKEKRFIPEYTQEFFKMAFEKAGGKLNIKNNIISIDSIPYEVRKIAENENFKKKYGLINKKYTNLSFDKDLVLKDSKIEFISFGHPLFEAVMQYIEEKFSDAISKGAIFYDPNNKLDGYIFVYEGEIRDAKKKEEVNNIAGKKIITIYCSKDGKFVNTISPHLIWNSEEENQPQNNFAIDISAVKEKTLMLAIKELEKYKNELEEERKRQANIKQKYGVKSLEILINEIDNDIISLNQRKEKGENVDLALRNKIERKKDYENSYYKLKDLI